MLASEKEARVVGYRSQPGAFSYKTDLMCAIDGWDHRPSVLLWYGATGRTTGTVTQGVC